MLAYAYSPGTGELETGGSLETHWPGILPYLLSSRPARDPDSKTQGAQSQGMTAEIVFWLAHTCTGMLTQGKFVS